MRNLQFYLLRYKIAGLWLKRVNNFPFDIDYLPGRKSSHNFSIGVSSCHPVSKTKFAFSQGNRHKIDPPHILQFLTDRSCQLVYKYHAFLRSLFPQLLIFAAFEAFHFFSFFTLILLTLQMVARARWNAEHWWSILFQISIWKKNSPVMSSLHIIIMQTK